MEMKDHPIEPVFDSESSVLILGSFPSVKSREAIFVNGKTAEKYYKKYIEKTINTKAVCLPSTSPANAAWNLERLVQEWSVIDTIRAVKSEKVSGEYF